jgi:hypothetical protein
MNSSAKMTVASFLAALALGAAAFTGCTATSGTVDNTDAGGSTGNPDSGTGNPDTGTGTATCEGTQPLVQDPTCQACVTAKCCTELQGCFAIQAAPPEKPYDCKGYVDEIASCNEKPEAERQSCYDDTDLTAADGIVDAVQKVQDCQTTKCATECGEQTDGG